MLKYSTGICFSDSGQMVAKINILQVVSIQVPLGFSPVRCAFGTKKITLLSTTSRFTSLDSVLLDLCFIIFRNRSERRG